MKKLIYFITLMLIISSCTEDKRFSNADFNLIPVKSSGKWGYSDTKGNFVISPQYDEAYLFTDGRALVKSNNKYGYINKKGKTVVQFIYKSATAFREGLAFVVSENDAPKCIDKKGNEVFRLTFASEVYSFSDGLALFSQNGKYGYVNKKGEIVINPQYDNAGDFSQELAPVKLNGKWGYIDNKGVIVINPQFDFAASFSEDLAKVEVNDQAGFINKEGNYLINTQYDVTADFKEGLAAFVQADKVGYVDKTGKVVINPQFDVATDFVNGLASVAVDDKWGVIDTKGKYVSPSRFASPALYFAKVAVVKIDNKYGFADKKGKFVVNPRFDDIVSIWDVQSNLFQRQVYSDFFDLEGLASEVSNNSSLQSIYGLTKEVDWNTAVNNTSLTSAVSSDAGASLVTYTLDKKLQEGIDLQTVEAYFTNNKIDFVCVTMQLSSLEPKLQGKSMAIGEAIVKKLSSKLNVSENAVNNNVFAKVTSEYLYPPTLLVAKESANYSFGVYYNDFGVFVIYKFN